MQLNVWIAMDDDGSMRALQPLERFQISWLQFTLFVCAGVECFGLNKSWLTPYFNFAFKIRAHSFTLDASKKQQ